MTAERTGTEGWPTPLHRQGCNLLFAPLTNADLWTTADRFGFLMLGRLESLDQLPEAGHLARFTSSLGFVLAEELLAQPGAWERVRQVFDAERSQLLGVQLRGPSPPTLPDAVAFLLCREEALAQLDTKGRSVIVLADAEPPAQLTERPDILGWIQG